MFVARRGVLGGDGVIRLRDWFDRGADRRADDVNMAVAASGSAEIAAPSRLKVLLVDDNDAMRALVARTLRQYFEADEIVEADNAADAEKLLAGTPLDLVLSDWRMPDRSGLEFLESVRAAGWDGVFGFITAETGASASRRAIEAGASFVVAKPFRAANLADQIAIAFGGRASDDECLSATPGDRVEKIAELLERTLGRSVIVTAAGEPPSRHVARMTTRYLDAYGSVAAVFVAELRLVTALAAALALFPPSVAQEWTCSGALPDALRHNFREVANVLSQVARDDAASCVVCEPTPYAPSEELVGLDLIEDATHELNLEIEIASYGSGRISFLDR